MTPSTTAVSVQLGKKFTYCGIRLRPGAWHASPINIVGQILPAQQVIKYDLEQVVQKLLQAKTDERWKILEQCAVALTAQGSIAANPLIEALLQQPLSSVAEAVSRTGYSERHIQRVLKETVGYTPHDFIKVLRFQRALVSGDLLAYSDQSHFIREHKHITGFTPQKFSALYS